MIENTDITSGQVKEAVRAVKKLRPAYTALLDFFEQIFVIQEDSKGQVHIDPIQIPGKELSLKAKEKFPLINISDFVIDTKLSGILLRKICNVAEGATSDMTTSARAIINAIDAEDLDLNTLFHALLGEDEAFFEKIAGKLEVDKNILGFITYNSMKPSLLLCAQQLSTYLDKDNEWGKGYCPICGSPPLLSMFQGEGERFLFCSFCWHKWPARRIYCPFCENNDSDTLHYFYSEKEKEYRIDVCNNCKKYIKTVDTRETGRIIYPPLEELSTLPLDIKAKKMGLESGVLLVSEHKNKKDEKHIVGF